MREKVSPMKSRVMFLPHFYNWQYDDMEMTKISSNIPVEEMEPGEIDWVEYQREHNLSDKEITYYYMKWMQLGKNINKLRQEFPTTPEEAFLSTGQTYFPTTKVMTLMANVVAGMRGELITNDSGNPEFQPVSSGYLEVFEKPVPGERYVIGGGYFFCIIILYIFWRRWIGGGGGYPFAIPRGK